MVLKQFGKNTRIPQVDYAKKIKEFRSNDLSVTSIEEVFEQVKTICTGGMFQPIDLSATSVFRGRRLKENFYIHLKHLWYPKVEDIKTEGRANRVGQQVFYGALSKDCAIFELHPKKGDLIQLIECQIRNGTLSNLVEVGLLENLKNESDQFNDAYSQSRNRIISLCNEYNISFENHLTVHKFLAQEYQKKVPKGSEFQYRSTIAISDLLMRKAKRDGIIYPSVALIRNKQQVNIAMTPTAADSYLIPQKCEIIEVLDYESEFTISANIIASSKISEDGAIPFPIHQKSS